MKSNTHTDVTPGSPDGDRRNPGAGYPGTSRIDATPRDEERRTSTKIPPPPPDDDDDVPPPPPPSSTGPGVHQSQKQKIPPPPPDDDADVPPSPTRPAGLGADQEQKKKMPPSPPDDDDDEMPPPPASRTKRQSSFNPSTDEACAENNASESGAKVEAENSKDPEFEEQVGLKMAILTNKTKGVCCIPADVRLKCIQLPGETVSKWKRFQTELPTAEELKKWMLPEMKIGGVAVVCGKVSGGLVCLDYDVKYDPSQGEMWKEFIKALPTEIAQKLVVESTQSGGKHAFFRMEAEIGNMKLAAVAEDHNKVPFETRGDGGYAICAPSRGYVLSQGQLNDVVQLGAAEVSEIWMAARAAAIQYGCVWIGDENASKEQGTSTSEKKKAVLTPIDDYNQRGDAVDLMKKHGWHISQEKPDGTVHLTRPGKDVGTSATWNHLGSRRLTVFTTCSEFSTSPSTYGAGAIYAFLECQGDFTKAASELRKSGYGDRTKVEAETPENSLWPEPEPLWSKTDDATKELPAFELTLLPSAFRHWVDDISTNMQAPPETAAVAAMIALSSVAARRLVIQPKVNDPWTEFVNLWGLVIGPPSAMKTPAVARALSPIRSLMKQASSDYESEMKAYSTLAEDSKRLQPIPKMRRYVVNDVTAPALAEVLIDNDDKSILIYQDEIASLLNQVSQKDGQQLRAMMLQGWKGVEPYVLDRIGRGVRYVDEFSISVLGTIQPDRLDSILLSSHGGTTSGDGLLQRFGLLVYPDQVQKYDYIDRPLNPSAYDVARKVFERIADLSVQPLPSGLTIHNEWNVPILRFDAAAQDLFADWVIKHQKFMRLSKLPPVLESHYTKYNKLIVTIAALLHIADYPNIGAISLGTLERSIAWIKLVQAHAEKIFSHRQTISDENQMALQLAKRLIEKYGSDIAFTMRDVGRNGWTGFNDNDFVEKILTVLTDKKWLQVEDSASKKTIRYKVNPKARKHLASN